MCWRDLHSPLMHSTSGIVEEFSWHYDFVGRLHLSVRNGQSLLPLFIFLFFSVFVFFIYFPLDIWIFLINSDHIYYLDLCEESVPTKCHLHSQGSNWMFNTVINQIECLLQIPYSCVNMYTCRWTVVKICSIEMCLF